MLSVVTIIPTATPIIPIIRQVNASIFPSRIDIRFALSLVTVEINKHKAEANDAIHAKVIKARPTKNLLQKSLRVFPYCGHCIVPHIFSPLVITQLCHKPIVIFIGPPIDLLLRKIISLSLTIRKVGIVDYIPHWKCITNNK